MRGYFSPHPIPECCNRGKYLVPFWGRNPGFSSPWLREGPPNPLSTSGPFMYQCFRH